MSFIFIFFKGSEQLCPLQIKKIKTQAQVWASKTKYDWEFFLYIKAKHVDLIY